MALRKERLPDDHCWWRIADPAWRDPLDPTFAQQRGGRWNPPDSFPTLYLNADQVTARLNLRAFISKWPFEPEDLRSDTGPILVGGVIAARTNRGRHPYATRGGKVGAARQLSLRSQWRGGASPRLSANRPACSHRRFTRCPYALGAVARRCRARACLVSGYHAQHRAAQPDPVVRGLVLGLARRLRR